MKVSFVPQERREGREGDVRSSLRRAAAGEGARARSAARSRGAECAERFRASEARRGLQLGDGREGASARGREARQGRAAPKALNDSARSATRSAAW